ncbi:tetratricopeptide repeat protein [Dethiosulfatarculus sandiegensis]|uniref:Response regulatory domain-containing protein n=1 Tax=Dethiosulfatarculus sandiegensis TaxID=1429043 RepID=A0A0D2J783_9BACT|nr:tetratricopeptide repeat protein [Dethiosulfatarculus sandiegensis]KIX11541.1 hypothetical protein X474_24005 [Dethiosulfatarculus sandiegensis]
MEDLNGTIILAHSEKTLRQTLRRILRDMGFRTIVEKENGTQAWAHLCTNGGDMIIAGWNMQEMNGLGLLKVARADADFGKIPIILVTRGITKNQVVEAGEAGVSDIVILPLAPKTLQLKLEAIFKSEADPTTRKVEGYYNQGVRYMEQERWQDALGSFQKVLKLHENAEVYYNMGYIKTAQGRYEEAIQYFRRATKINQDFARAYKRMGECYLKLGRKKLAEKSMHHAAEIYMEKQMDDNAEQILQQVLSFNPDTTNVFNSLGIIYRRQGRYQKAIDQYLKALKVNPGDENIYYNLGRIYYETNKYQKAKEVLVKSIELNPSFNEARQMLELIQAETSP